MVLTGACLLAITPFFWWGSPSGHDFEFHMFSWMDVLGQWKHGIAYPRWAELAHWGYGEARFLFYPPASWTLGAALGAILPWKMVPGTYCWIVLTLAGAGMYRVAREWLPAPDALFAAVFYALNPYHLLVVYWRSAYAELLASALLPLLLYLVLQLSFPRFTENESEIENENSPRNRPTLWLSLLLGASWLTNEPAAVMIYYSTAGLALLCAAIQAAREAAHAPTWNPVIWRPVMWVFFRILVRALVRPALAMLLGAGIASFYLLPAIHEQGWINLSEVLSPGVRPQDNFLFTTIADPDHNRFNLLVSTIALAEIGALALAIWFSRRKKNVGTAGCPEAPSATDAISDQNRWMVISAWGVACAVLMLSLSNPLWQHFPKLRFVQLPFRWLLCMNVALAMLLPMAARRWSTRLLASSILLAVVVVAGSRIQPPWWDKAADIREMSAAIANGTGYEGTDEYVPAGADPYELDKNLPLVSDDTGAPIPIRMLVWEPTEKHFIVHSDVHSDVQNDVHNDVHNDVRNAIGNAGGSVAPQNLVVHLFNYPAWTVVINGKPTATQETEVTGLMVIPIAGGENDVQIHFRRTSDRVAGDVVTLISLLTLVFFWLRTRPGDGAFPSPGGARPHEHGDSRTPISNLEGPAT